MSHPSPVKIHLPPQLTTARLLKGVSLTLTLMASLLSSLTLAQPLEEERPLPQEEERPLPKESEAPPSPEEPTGSKPPQAPSGKSDPSGSSSGATRELGAERALPNERAELRQRAPSRSGATGLAEVFSADTGPQGTIRIGVHFGGFSSDQFLTKGVEERFLSTRANVAYTPHELIELYVSARSVSHTNPLTSPSTIQSQGDMNLGGKLGQFWGHFGAAFALDLQMFSAPDGGWALDATSVNLHGLMTYDLNRGEAPVPFRFLFHSQYTVERSEALFNGLPELPSLVQEWAYQAGYYNRLHLRFGVEAPFEHVSPFIEYHIGTPFEVEMPRMGKFSRIFAFESVPQSVNAGLRGFVLDRLNLDLVATLGMSDAPFTGVPATPPWALWASVNYTLDPRPEVIEREIKITPPPPKVPDPKPLGTLIVLTITNPEGAPIKGAQLTYLNDKGKTPQLTDERGVITGYRFTAPVVPIKISAEGYLDRLLKLKLKSKQETLSGKIKLKPAPKPKLSSLQVSLSQRTAPGEEPTALPEALIGARFELSVHGPQTLTETISFEAEPVRLSLQPGEYALTLSQSGTLKFHQVISLGAGGELKRVISPGDLLGSSVDQPEPAKARKQTRGKARKKKRSPKPRARGQKRSGRLVSLNRRKRALNVKQKITFKGDSATLSSQGVKVSDAVAKLIRQERSIKSVTVVVHTHSIGSSAADKQLSLKRGEAIRDRITRAGVKAGRVKVVGYGSSKSIASNLTSAGRRKNQRVSFKVSLKD